MASLVKLTMSVESERAKINDQRLVGSKMERKR